MRSRALALAVALSFPAAALAAGGPPSIPGNSGVPGLLAQVEDLEAQLSASEAEVTALTASLQATEATLAQTESDLLESEASVALLEWQLDQVDQVEWPFPGPVGPLAPVAATGQTTCWDVDHELVNCAGTGQDGELQSGVAGPAVRFADNQDGTYTDNRTGLTWMEGTTCFPFLPFDTALYVARLLADGACGLSDGSIAGDWRVPNIREMLSLVDYGEFNPSLPEGHPFTDVPTWDFWTSTTSQAPDDPTGWIDPPPPGYGLSVSLAGTGTGRWDKETALPFWVVRD